MRVAAIDIGTNTVLLLVAERRQDGAAVAVEEHATITRLGEGVDRSRVLAPAAIERTNECLDRYAEVIARTGAERVAVVGTSAMRDAGGGEAVRAHVQRKLGVDVQILSGDEEARLTFAGALSGLPALDADRDVRVFDIGGGSTEIVHGNRRTGAIQFAKSYDVGSVRLTERHVKTDPPTRSERAAVLEAARAAFDGVPAVSASEPRLAKRPGGASQASADAGGGDLAPEPVGIAGTMTTLAAVQLGMDPYDGARVHGFSLKTVEIEQVVERLAALPLEQRQRVPGLEPKRADVIISGALVALAYLGHVGASAVTISDRGVRWGLAEALLPSTSTGS
jgi:exopolyphosphatase / guanosine-5'-triphosphate,3'-diphosphate pyrophosphatase